MRCPYCGERETRVLDSRPVEIRIRRRRECSRCGKRFTTYEVVERPLLMVQKRTALWRRLTGKAPQGRVQRH